MVSHADLVALRRVRDRIDREYAQPLGTFSTRFKELVGVSPREYRAQAFGHFDGVAPCLVKRIARPVRNREAPAGEAP